VARREELWVALMELATQAWPRHREEVRHRGVAARHGEGVGRVRDSNAAQPDGGGAWSERQVRSPVARQLSVGDVSTQRQVRPGIWQGSAAPVAIMAQRT
jgi:hypothetical protein